MLLRRVQRSGVALRHQDIPAPRTSSCRLPARAGRHASVIVTASWFGGGDKEEAARKALQGLTGKGKPGDAAKAPPGGGAAKVPPGGSAAKTPPAGSAAKAPLSSSGSASTPSGSNPLDALKNMFTSAAASTGGGGGGSGSKGFGGGGGGGGGGFNAQPEEGDEGADKPYLQDLRELLVGCWTVFSNLALFMAFSCWLHRTLTWAIDVELLFLVNAPQQALEKVATLFFEMIEAVEVHALGWELPNKPGPTMKAHEEVGQCFPREHAYTFDGYRYPKMTVPEKELLVNAYALRHWERPGGTMGDVDPAEVKRIHDKYEPMEADRREWQRAKAAGTLDAYWAQQAKAGLYEQMVGRPRPTAALPKTA